MEDMTTRFFVVVNGELEKGYFLGGNRFEERGPIFPYLLLLVMDGFYAFLNQKIEAGPFSYPPKFRALKLRTWLCK